MNVFVIKNQYDAFLDKSGDWVSSELAKTLYRTPNKDEAINQKVEIAVKDPHQRLELISANLDDKGNPMLTGYELKVLETEISETETSSDASEVNSEAETSEEAPEAVSESSPLTQTVNEQPENKETETEKEDLDLNSTVSDDNGEQPTPQNELF